MIRTGGNTRLMGVIGDPVRHSLSPMIHSLFIERSGIDAVYLAFPVKRGCGNAFLDAARQTEMLGFNVTMPLKEEMFRLVDPAQSGLNGAVNTVCLRDGAFCGFNTDGTGFLNAIETTGRNPLGLTAVLLGTGGTAAALSLVMEEAGFTVRVCGRNLKAAEALTSGGAFPFDRIGLACEKADLLVNATPLGMTGQGDFASYGFLDALPKHALVADMVYNPRQTGLIRAARERGLEGMNGISHLVHQAALSFEHFTDLSVDKETALEIICKLQKEEKQL